MDIGKSRVSITFSASYITQTTYYQIQGYSTGKTCQSPMSPRLCT